MAAADVAATTCLAIWTFLEGSSKLFSLSFQSMPIIQGLLLLAFGILSLISLL